MGIIDGVASWFGAGTSPQEASEAEEVSKYSDECFLLDYIDVVSQFNRNDVKNKKKVYQNFIPVEAKEGSGAYEIISRLTSRDGLTQFLNIRPADLALLQPKVRLYKCVYPSAGAKPNILEIQFGEHIESSILEAISGVSRSRTGGAGLKEFSWSFGGTNPASAEKVIDVSMSLVFQTVQDLLGDKYLFFDGTMDPTREISDAEQEVMDNSASFLDLIWQPPTQARQDEKRRANEYVPKDYKIKAEIGWSLPNLQGEKKFPSLTVSDSTKLLAELKKMNLSMYLNLVSHELSIKENGGVELKIDYVASITSAID